MIPCANEETRGLDEPAWKPTTVKLGADVGAGAQNDPHPRLPAQLDEVADVRVTLKRESALARLVEDPWAGGGDGVESGLLGGGDPVGPGLGGDAGVLQACPKHPDSAPVDGKALSVVGHTGHGRRQRT